jgi:hypothetical protein
MGLSKFERSLQTELSLDYSAAQRLTIRMMRSGSGPDRVLAGRRSINKHFRSQKQAIFSMRSENFRDFQEI